MLGVSRLLQSVKMVMGLVLIFVLGACSDPASQGGFDDPFEQTNRKIHGFNKSVDTILLSPVSDGYGAAVNDDFDTMLSNFVENASLPNRAINNALQGDVVGFLDTTTRLVLNTTLGFGGLFDLATGAGLPNEETDFGETLHRWGAAEGRYLELPFVGGSTERDALGILVDFGMDPLGSLSTAAQANQLRAAKVLEAIGDRHVYGDLIESVLYASEDSYATQRQFYLENRRFELGGGEVNVDDLEDPYADE